MTDWNLMGNIFVMVLHTLPVNLIAIPKNAMIVMKTGEAIMKALHMIDS